MQLMVKKKLVQRYANCSAPCLVSTKTPRSQDAIMVPLRSAFALALLGSSQALRPAARTTVAMQPQLSISRRQLATAATAAAVSSLPMPGSWRASAASNLKKKKALVPELVLILRVKESTFQETRLITSGKFKDLQRLNIKRAIGMMLENSEVRAGESNPRLGVH